jgi:hypothetical protein
MKASDLFVKALENEGVDRHLRGSQAREPRRRRVASHLEHPAVLTRTSSRPRFMAATIWPADGRPWRLHGDAPAPAR